MGANLKPRKRETYPPEEEPKSLRFDVVTVGNILLGYWPDESLGLSVAIDDKYCELSDAGVANLIAHLRQWLDTKTLKLPKPPEPINYAI